MKKDAIPQEDIGNPIATAFSLAELLKTEVGNQMKANWDGAWDRCDVGEVTVVKVNRGAGFEDALVVAPKSISQGYMLYFGPYALENLPTQDTILLFYCNEAVYIEFGAREPWYLSFNGVIAKQLKESRK